MAAEWRSVVEPVEFRAEGKRLIAAGVAMRYGTKSKPIGGQFREVFKPGAFARSLPRQVVEAHNEHGGPYLAGTANRTLRLADSRTELAFEIDLPDTTAGRDAAHLLERQDIKGSSIGFRAVPSGVHWTNDGAMALRTVSEAHLYVVDLTTKPAYDDSTAEMALRSVPQLLAAAQAGRLAEAVRPRRRLISWLYS